MSFKRHGVGPLILGFALSPAFGLEVLAGESGSRARFDAFDLRLDRSGRTAEYESFLNPPAEPPAFARELFSQVTSLRTPEVLAALYLWVPLMDGDVTVKGFSTDVEVGYDEISEMLDEIRFGIMGHVEVGFDPWTAWADLVYLSIEDENNVRNGEIESRFDQVILDIGLAAKVAQWDLSQDRKIELEGLLGTRWNSLELDLDLQAPPLTGDRDQRHDWWDFILGARVKADLTEKLNLVVRGDFGGFDWGSSSDSTWQLAGNVNYEFGRWIAGLGYRALYIDYDRGSGNQAFEYDILIHGPFLGVGYRF